MGLLTPIGTINNATNVTKLQNFAQKYGSEILRQQLSQCEFVSHFPVETDVVNEKGYMKLTVNNVLKPYTGSVNTAGDEVVYSHRKLSVSVGQSDLAIDPEQVRSTPFVNDMLINITEGKKVYHEGIIMAEFAKQAMAQLNNFTFYKGDKSLVNTTTPKALLVADGLEKMITQCIAASDPLDKLTPVVIPAFNEGAGWVNVTDEGNMLESFQKVDDDFDVAYKTFERTQFVSHQAYKKYKNNYKRRYKNDPKYEKYDGGVFEFMYLEDTGKRVKIAPATWLGTSNRIIDVIDGCIRVGTDTAGMASSIKVQESGYLFIYMMKLCFGVQIVDPAGVRIGSLS